MIVLGIDPGTKCGWCLLDGEKRLASGVWNLSPKRHEGGGMRFVRLRAYFVEVLRQAEVVAYEEVRRHMGVDAAHIYGGIVAVITEVCEAQSKPYRGIPVGTAKKLLTGKGNADKPAMVAAANVRFAPHEVETDDEADALAVALALHRELAF